MRSKSKAFMYIAHLLAATAAVMVLVWCIHFRGGLAFESANKSLIFNVTTISSSSSFVLLL